MTPTALIGRRGELAELTRAWSRVTSVQAGPSVAVITGASGIGKSRLVREALHSFTPAPVPVLAGTARLHDPAPYDWLAAVLSRRDVHDASLPPDGLAWLAQHPDAPAVRYAPGALLRIAVRTVRALIGTGPACLVVEDLHALDPASLNLLGELADEPGLPALLLITSRPPEHPLVARTVARLAGAPGAIRQHLGRLSVAEVAEFLDDRFGDGVTPELAEAVWSRTNGNPYWLMELLAAVRGHEPQALVTEPLPAHLSLDAAPLSESAETLFTSAGADLTGREEEVLACLAAGMSNKQVARSLDISVKTVAVHVSNLLRKTGSASRTEVALWALRRG
ncbi:DNA-binding CsgD family transcriptional regulator [Allocatelliglobosispora scoriae]|uniref:DNA-binding CsgD family transcriptional regulator n=1 Tax=Allocatelliglobosispora scoriae TaxID=643052 RepID=A0A841BS23_9ACTN|nr:AAA family ATPase [Allocatelliglobosispora scoriae]MBB5869600.1 DNA-binding CsgD family transcriptional regulator [Allocatelliglobosispora scoriae]